MKIIIQRGLLILFLFINHIVLFAQTDNIPWSASTKLTWDDFQGPPDNSSQFLAKTTYLLGYSCSWSSVEGTSVNVTCNFVKSKSWKKADKPLTPELLKHEQLHFDIAEVYARKIRKACAEYISSHKSSKNANTELDNIFKKLSDESYTFQDSYDDETKHSTVTAKQEEWNNKVPKMLSDLAAYAQ